ncbi:MAG: hypothetical protein KF745_03015 [Phycisphaeraceae bacterium]|nr:hypothetical protein [Phycisphaeraceae bacterium]
MKVLIADQFEESGRDGLAALGCEVVFSPELTPESLADAIAKVDPKVLIVRSKKVRPQAIASGASLGVIIRAGAGYDTIDTNAAAKQGVAVCNCPGTNSVAVAELVFALLLSCDRRVPDQTADAREGKWNKKEYSKARGLKGLTLGVIGVGAIGRQVIKRARAFDMEVQAHSLNMTPERALDLGVGYGGRTREELLRMVSQCDAVTIHVAANPESERMCDGAFFGAMREGAYFINTSRGSVVDDGALREAVAGRKIRAGLDVFMNEPGEGVASWRPEVASLGGVYCSHHVGASTEQAQRAVAEEVVRIVRVYKETGRAENRVN